MFTLDTKDKAATKATAYEYIADALDTGEPLSEEKLRALFLYFAPAAPAKPKTPERWVAKFAAGKSETRGPLRYCHSDGTQLRASDGRIAARCDTTLPAGFYDPKTLVPVDVDLQFPQIERVFPKPGKLQPFDPATSETVACSDLGTTKLRLKLGEQWVPHHQWAVIASAPAVRFQPGDTVHRSIRGETDFGEFVIMPMRV